ncbi:DUF742 domain-containing protein [Yinghuangia sp. ASG 101]|uniref:DUF742 domain-containing protein n=1 Tax=Yinghuangia sp. ASG 101 TaxID=2896848 RepID=UPI001E6405DD|nr:DUF742 domain-containing protein [Yinghuangia sp. ASG 101]UGQ14231.1 DUF742 domain-containing protein [Yinghuangia sp. ASG 101]
MAADDGGRTKAEGRPARVRPYALTRGRTDHNHDLHVETLVTTLDCATDDAPESDADPGDMPEVRDIIALCRGVRSVAEVSALLDLPLGVVRVLVSDLAGQDRISVYPTAGDSGRPNRALLERLLGGLRRL